ncbi:hypothetical protein [Jiangella alkaliphila]|uniref:Uncharacterized protein n=1 Tax=Jiangella alkaliphila TaxID=419479 RepID=A0A1H2M0F3_9ACTN|nr:hypothetical protein [Jiangella alkaliphila]SDU86475.1 hypothetical protein SAMN04488563_6890 [Jiangella alkaliphila]
MGSRPWRHAVPAALLVALTAACGGVQEDGATAAPEPSWQDHVLPSDYDLPDTPPETLAAAELVSQVFADPSRDGLWGKYHYTDDGDGVVVNLVPGWEDSVIGDEMRQVIATAPAPVEVREVEHSNRELMHAFMDIALTDPVIAGASLTSGVVDAELNALVIGLTEVDEQSVAAVTEVFGPDVYVRQEEQATSDPAW